MKNFSQIPYNWYGLIEKCDLNMEDINLLGIINSLTKTQYGCIAQNSYFENILKVPNIRFNIGRLERAKLIQINEGKVRKITINNTVLNDVKE